MPLKAFRWSFISFVNRYVPSETPDWSEGKILCKQCVLKLMGRHILNSLRENKAQRGSSRLFSYNVSESDRIVFPEGPQLEDCWYGYNCRTQRKCDHAIKLNVCDVFPVRVVILV